VIGGMPLVYLDIETTCIYSEIAGGFRWTIDFRAP
jgi:hypothetical protein